MKVCISIPLKNRLQITISVITVLFWPNITLLKCKYRKVYINICSNRLLLPSNPYTPSGKNCNNWNCNYRNTNNLQKSLVFQKHFVPLRAALLKHPDEALMDDIGEMWSLECSPKYYVDCWMNMMQKFFDVNDALKGIFKNYRKTFNDSLSSTKP